MALLFGEAEAELIGAILASDEEFVIAAGTLAQALIVAGRRGSQAEMSELLDVRCCNKAGRHPPAVAGSDLRRWRLRWTGRKPLSHTFAPARG
jgi:hypothetical protein